MNRPNVARAIACVKCDQCFRDYVKYCQEREIPDMPAVITGNDICRGDYFLK